MMFLDFQIHSSLVLPGGFLLSRTLSKNFYTVEVFDTSNIDFAPQHPNGDRQKRIKRATSIELPQGSNPCTCKILGFFRHQFLNRQSSLIQFLLRIM